MSNKLEHLEFKLGKNNWDLENAGKVRKEFILLHKPSYYPNTRQVKLPTVL